MPTISISARVSLPIPNQQVGMFTQEIGFRDIDVEGDVGAQIAACAAAIAPTSEAIHEKLAQELANLSGLSVEGLGLAAEMNKFKERVISALNKIVAEVKSHKKMLSELDIEELRRQFGVTVKVEDEQSGSVGVRGTLEQEG